MLKIYNTPTRQEDEFKPLIDMKVGMYVCGPTVYGPDHLGHARTFIFFDWLRRFLETKGYEVNFVQNITDVGHLVHDADEGEDKIEKKAKAEGKTPQEIARGFEDEHFKDMESLNIKRPTIAPRATEHIFDIIEFIKVLIQKGFAYQSDGDVYFNVSKLSSYGELSHQNINEMVFGERVEIEKNKKNPQDFALWKKAGPEHLQKWPSPWGEGFPGWHIECSAMSTKFLGQPFDIHGSAVEHIFPHHENELAQSKAYAGKPMADYWVHSGMLFIDGKKMAKSAGNFITVKDLLKKYSSDVLKIALMATEWRRPFDWNEKAAEDAQKLARKLVQAKMAAKDGESGFKEKLEAVLDDNFNTPKALTLILENLNILTKEDFSYIEKVFGLGLKEEKKLELTASQKELLSDREDSRKNKDWARADEIRLELEEQGIIVEDTAEGQRISKK